MSRFDKLVSRWASPADQRLLEEHPTLTIRLGVMARTARRFIWVTLGALLVGGLMTCASGMDIYHRTEMPEFCSSCHEMRPNATSWEVSTHKSIKCVDCHARPGVSGWMSAKLSGIRQLMRHVSAASIKDINVDGAQRKIISENCRRCHAGSTRLNERLGLRIAHKHHLEIGANCVACHSGKFAHPEPQRTTAAKTSLVPRGTCFNCHDGKRTVGSVVAFQASDGTNCVRCHLDASVALQHGGGDLSCGDCHQNATDHFAYTEKTVHTICANCHDIESGYPSTHQPYASKNCSACHRVMYPTHLYKTSPKPTAQLCFSCHGTLAKRLARGGNKLAPGKFNNGREDLHRAHAEQLGDDGDWCLACHAGHVSRAKRGLIRFRKQDAADASTPGLFAATATGGSCSGGCHADDARSYPGGAER